MKKSIYVIPLLITLSSCGHYQARHIASAEISPPELEDLNAASSLILTDVHDKNFPEHCVSYLSELERKIDSLDISNLPVSHLSKHTDEITENSWSIRKTLHQRLPEFDKDCLEQVQASFRQFRFIEDYLLELKNKATHLSPSEIDFQNQPVPMKDSLPFYVLRQRENETFQSGDLLITRGVSFLSGMIARLGERPTQFSHVVMLYKDPKSGEMKTIESYVGVGVQFYDLNFALKNENARILWLRAKDKKLGQEAASKMGAFVKERLDQNNPIKYDYALDFNNPETMSCAEVSQVAFQMASDDQVRIPYHPNKINGPENMVERLKLVKGDTFEPGDMEIDPRFELLGEFQDLRLTRDSRQKDAIMSAMFRWLDEKDYVMKDNMKSKLAGGMIYNVRRTFLWPLVQKMLKIDDFSKEIPRNMLRTTALINDVGAVLLTELKKRDLEFERKNGLPMTYMDFYKALEEMRVEDLKLYENKKTRKASLFHKMIGPR